MGFAEFHTIAGPVACQRPLLGIGHAAGAQHITADASVLAGTFSHLGEGQKNIPSMGEEALA